MRKNVACSMYEFKEKVKALITTPSMLAAETKSSLEHLKSHYLANVQKVKNTVREMRPLRILTQLVWVTICAALELKDEMGKLEDFTSVNYRNIRTPTRSTYSRSRSPIVQRASHSPMYREALNTSVLQRKQNKNLYVNLGAVRKNPVPSLKERIINADLGNVSTDRPFEQTTERTVTHMSEINLHEEHSEQTTFDRQTAREINEPALEQDKVKTKDFIRAKAMEISVNLKSLQGMSAQSDTISKIRALRLEGDENSKESDELQFQCDQLL